MPDRPIRILAVDDDAMLLAVLEAGLRLREDCQVTALTRPAAALAEMEHDAFDLLVTDYALGDPNHNGLDLMRAAHARPHRPLVIIITAFATLEITLEAINQGAYDFLTKPFQLEELQLVVRNATNQIRLTRANQELRAQLGALAETLLEMEARQHELLDKLRQLEENHGGGLHTPLSPEAQSLNGAPVHGVRRRQVLERITGYARMTETLLEQVHREQERIQALRQKGLLGEDEYRKMMAAHDVPPSEQPKSADPSA